MFGFATRSNVRDIPTPKFGTMFVSTRISIIERGLAGIKEVEGILRAPRVSTKDDSNLQSVLYYINIVYSGAVRTHGLYIFSHKMK